MLSSCIGVVMKDGALLRSSSLLLPTWDALDGECLFLWMGYFFYYGFPWWIVGAGVDDVARSLFLQLSSLLYFLSVGVLVLYSFSQ